MKGHEYYYYYTMTCDINIFFLKSRLKIRNFLFFNPPRQPRKQQQILTCRVFLLVVPYLLIMD